MSRSSERERPVIGVDVGGSFVKYGLFAPDGALLESWREPAQRGAALLDAIASSVQGALARSGMDWSGLAGVGVCAPGPVDARGVVLNAPNVDWRELNLPEELGARMPAVVSAVNDGNAAALGEVWQGCAAGCRNFVLITLGTGIGGGIVMNGALLTGARGACGEIGHLRVEDVNPLPCVCGLRGCFECYASARGLAHIARAHLDSDEVPSALRGAEIDAKAVFDAAASGDAAAREIVARYGYYLGKGMAQIATLLNPERIALGGGMSAAGQALIDCALPSFREYAYPVAREAQLCLAALGNRAGMTGAAKLALDRAARSDGRA